MPEITQELIANVANRRARGRSWEAISIEFAEVFPGDPDTLRNAMWREPEFERYCDIAEKDLAREGEAEMVILFRNRMRSQDESVALKAGMALAKHLASKAREATRIEVERIRSNTAIAKMKLRENATTAKTRASATREPREESPKPDPNYRYSPSAAEVTERRGSDDLATVYLWSGEHPLGNHLPTAADTPLVVSRNHTVSGRVLYWANRFPVHTSPVEGPYYEYPPAFATQPVAITAEVRDMIEAQLHVPTSTIGTASTQQPSAVETPQAIVA